MLCLVLTSLCLRKLSPPDIYTWQRVWPHIASIFGMRAGDVKTTKLETEMQKHLHTWKLMAKKYSLLEPDINKVATWWFAVCVDSGSKTST